MTSSISQIESRVALSSLVIGHPSRIGDISTEPTWTKHFSTLWCSTIKTKYFLKAHDPLTTHPSSTQTLQTHPYLKKFIGCLAEGGGTEKCSSYFRWKSDQHPKSARSCDEAGNFYIWIHMLSLKSESGVFKVFQAAWLIMPLYVFWKTFAWSRCQRKVANPELTFWWKLQLLKSDMCSQAEA